MEITVNSYNNERKCKNLEPGTIVRIRKEYDWFLIIPHFNHYHFAVINSGYSNIITGSSYPFKDSEYYNEVPFEIIGKLSIKI